MRISEIVSALVFFMYHLDITGYCYYSHYLILLLQLPPAAASGAHPPTTTPVDSTATASMKNVSCLSQKGRCSGEEEERRVYFISINMM